MLMLQFIVILIPFIAYVLVSNICSITYNDYTPIKYNKCVTTISIIVELFIIGILFILMAVGFFDFSTTVYKTVDITIKCIIPIVIAIIFCFNNILNLKKKSYEQLTVIYIVVLALIIVAFAIISMLI